MGNIGNIGNVEVVLMAGIVLSFMAIIAAIILCLFDV